MKGSTVPIRKNRPSVLVWKGLAWERKTEDWLAPVSGVVTSDCGKRENPLLHKQELHDGLDIAVPEGTEVVAVKSGRVTEVRTSATYGKGRVYDFICTSFGDIGENGGENQAGTGGGKIGEYGTFHRAASALWDLSGWEAAEPDGVFAGGGNGEGIEISSEVGEDEKFASLELSRQNKGVLPYFLC